jgi:hypothetical protein
MTKSEIREIMLDIIARHEPVKYEPDQCEHLFIGVAQVAERRAGKTEGLDDPRLNHDDAILALEVFWDLILDRIITPGTDDINPLPFFRVHSEAGDRLKRLG